MRIEPRTFRNVFPSLSPEQISNLAQYYDFKLVAGERVAGHTHRHRRVRTEGRPALRAQVLVRRDHRAAAQGAPRQREGRGRSSEFAFTDVAVNAKIDKDMVEAVVDVGARRTGR